MITKKGSPVYRPNILLRRNDYHLISSKTLVIPLVKVPINSGKPVRRMEDEKNAFGYGRGSQPGGSSGRGFGRQPQTSF
jgi:hypothetical protein